MDLGPESTRDPKKSAIFVLDIGTLVPSGKGRTPLCHRKWPGLVS